MALGPGPNGGCCWLGIYLLPSRFESFWIVLSIIALIAIIITCISLEAEIGWLVISVLLGGITMVVGYFLYSSIIMGPIAAKAEIPFNILLYLFF